jgi:hypothetical protein
MRTDGKLDKAIISNLLEETKQSTLRRAGGRRDTRRLIRALAFAVLRVSASSSNQIQGRSCCREL